MSIENILVEFATEREIMQINLVSHCYSYVDVSLSVVGIDILRISGWYSNAMKECTSVMKPSEFAIILPTASACQECKLNCTLLWDKCVQL